MGFTGTVTPSSSRARDGAGVRALRALSGAVAAGLVVLAIVVAMAGWFASIGGTPGPGRTVLTGHAVLAGFAVVVQLAVVDRRWPAPGVRVLSSLGVLVLAAVAVWLWWLA